VKLYTASQSGWHSVKRGSSDYVIVDAFSIDDIVTTLNLKSADVVKIDVEGAEVEALFGAREILKTFQPKVILEIVNRGNFNAIKIFANNLNLEESLEELKKLGVRSESGEEILFSILTKYTLMLSYLCYSITDPIGFHHSSREITALKLKCSVLEFSE
jgi:hypothetical protein